MSVRRQAQRALRFRDLMPYRIAEVLLVSSPYDAFILEQDGRLTEQVFLRFSSLSLTASPRFAHAATGEAALDLLASRRFDLVIAMTSLADVDVAAFGRRVKRARPGLPVVLLAVDRKQLHDLAGSFDRGALDGVFLWSGDASILLAIIKYVEDRENVDSDVEHGDVRVIVVVEDSPADYSSFLGFLYLELMKQAQALYSEGVNEILRQVSMNSRPKILHAVSYEEGVGLLERYRSNLMALISDLGLPRGGETDGSAGLDLVRIAREIEPALPVLLQSADPDRETAAAEVDALFVDKRSPDLRDRIRAFLAEGLGFGDFVFRDGQGREIDRARDLRQLEEKLAMVPVESVYYHAARDHFSIWLQARSEFRLAEIIRPQKVSDFTGVESTRRYLIDALRETHEDTLRGVVSDFHPRDFEHDPFSRLGRGSLGGKARGMAFLNTLLADLGADRLGDLRIAVPKTVVVTTDYFDHFLDANDLRQLASTCRDDRELRRRFLATPLSEPLLDDLELIVRHLEVPLAVRSSSLLEDSLYQPLAGIYDTLMLPNDAAEPAERLRDLADAVKLVYASTFLANARAYLRSSGNRVEEEKMAVMIQALVGRRHGRRYYPCFSGVAQSYNYYPVGPQKAEDGVVFLALGLGRTVVDGGQALRFSPRHPQVQPQFYDLKALLDRSQRGFYALDMGRRHRRGLDLLRTVEHFPLEAAERDGTLNLVGSVYTPDDQRIREDLRLAGPRVVTFNNVLQHRALPLADAVLELLAVGREGLGSAVEVEFACDTGDCPGRGEGGEARPIPTFYLLQIRPIARRGVAADPDRVRFCPEDRLCSTRRSLGDGVDDTLRDVVYVRRDRFDPARTRDIAAQIEELNRAFGEQGRRYVLIGPGRWGTADPWMGIPVQWRQISNVGVMVEASPAGFEIEPSQGAHFFHNITALEIGYLSLPPGAGCDGGDETLDWSWLDAQSAERETEHLRHVRFNEPLTVVLDGRRGRGVIAKPGARRLGPRATGPGVCA